MGTGLYEKERVFREEMERCLAVLKQQSGADIRNWNSDRRNLPEDTEIVQPLLFCFEYALARTWMNWGVVPEAMIGHSLGEYVAACLAQVFTLEEALRLVTERGRLMQNLPRDSMLAVAESAAVPDHILAVDLCPAPATPPPT